ncbi:coiled-coil domain-containing protein [Natranaerobius thermophilus]|uniref:Uncharacterized protein n=1 Tax=Natranaerobius thermophilus (strain ATCC BAA-1301 / DSM 18059 / JW/NM-WN-LF) TaxID=457570 RepID=B2A5H4_NATTJ|nr:hypothetical protein [Natranaerobius thermophilus]ACB85329.1 hypothetical protein Nther_1757 [Natranaerobius thermophilus JW/NM-WN-LF]
MMNLQKSEYKSIIVTFTLLIIFHLVNFNTTAMTRTTRNINENSETIQKEDISELGDLKNEIKELNEQELKIQEELFQLSREKEKIRIQKSTLKNQINKIEQQISQLNKEISEQQERYQKAQANLGDILTTLQKMGPLSYLEELLDAGSTEVFISRLNIIRGFISDIRTTIDNLISNKEALQEKEKVLSNTLDQQEQTENELKNKSQNLTNKYKQQEQILEEVSEQRQQFEDRMKHINLAWENAVSELDDLEHILSDILSTHTFDEEQIELSGNIFSMQAKIYEDTFISIIEKEQELEKITFSLDNDKVKLTLTESNSNEEKHLYLNPVPKNNSYVELKPTKFEFLGLDIASDQLGQQISNSNIVLDFSEELAGYRIKEINIQEDYMKLQLSFN